MRLCLPLSYPRVWSGGCNDRLSMNRSPLSLFGLFAISLAACGAPAPLGEQVAADGEFLTFDPENVLSDGELTDSGALDADRIQAFLEKTHCGNRSSLADYTSNGKTAAQAMAEAASQYQINPIEFLTRIQMEQGLICNPADQASLDRAFGCGCPDGQPCSPQFLGFDKQVACAAKSLRSYLDDIASDGETIAGWAPHKAKLSLDKYSVTPENAATAALYTYTPWVYNGGNNLHFQVWNAIVAYLGKTPLVHTDSKPKQSLRPRTCSEGDTACHSDVDCHHGNPGAGVVCANSGPARGSCIEACHSDADCPSGSTCDTGASPHWKCSAPYPGFGTACASDSDCNKGAQGAARVCSSQSGKCILGCHEDTDCAKGAVCDRSLPTWTCVSRKAIGEPCGTDDDCNGGVDGTQRVCGNEKVCIDACHTDRDCEKTWYCSHETEKWSCKPRLGDESDNGCRAPESCPVLEFPSGVKIQTRKDAALTKVYGNHLGSSDTAPECFIDIDDLYNPDTGQKYDYSHVKLSDNFTLRELVDTEVSQGWSRRVLVSPAMVEALQSFRDAVGVPVSINSGYRSPLHQEAVCKAMCGNPLGCPGTCSNNSRHMYGDGLDLPDQFYSKKYAQMACDAGFRFAYAELCDHLHVDMNPRNSSCVISFDQC